jgi:SAM-dependent methyltransferase
MHLDVIDLQRFYRRSPLGRLAQRCLRAQILRMWPEIKAQTLVGFGYAVPLLRPYLPQARRVMALMPGPQGVAPWPTALPNVASLVEEAHWPIATGHADRLILMHALETSDNPGAVLQEAHRVLGPGGRAMFIVPNRVGLWARRDVTPFGYGRPYSLGQLETQLRLYGFAVERHASALFFPASGKRHWLRMGPMLEAAGRSVSGLGAGGVLLVEASKQVYAPINGGTPAPVTARKGLGLLEPSRPIGQSARR